MHDEKRSAAQHGIQHNTSAQAMSKKVIWFKVFFLDSLQSRFDDLNIGAFPKFLDPIIEFLIHDLSV